MVLFLWCFPNKLRSCGTRDVKHRGGAERSVSPVGCSPKAKATRKRGEQRSVASGSEAGLRGPGKLSGGQFSPSNGPVGPGQDYCEPDRAKRDHRFEPCCDHHLRTLILIRYQRPFFCPKTPRNKGVPAIRCFRIEVLMAGFFLSLCCKPCILTRFLLVAV